MPGPDPDRILLVGGGICVGWGVSSHSDALGGHLARAVSTPTGRGVSLDAATDDILSGTAMVPARVTELLRMIAAVIIPPGDVEEMLLVPAAAYHRRLDDVLDHVTRPAPASVRVFGVGLIPLKAVIRLPRTLRSISSRLPATLDRYAHRTRLARANATFVLFSADEFLGREGSGSTHERWAKMITPTVWQQLDASLGNSIRGFSGPWSTLKRY